MNLKELTLQIPISFSTIINLVNLLDEHYICHTIFNNKETNIVGSLSKGHRG